MKTLLTAVAVALAFGGCGYSQRDSELVGQVKKVVRVTPLICPDYVAADVSLGVMRGGVGSMSTEDVWLRVYNRDDEAKLKEAADSGALVKVRYDVKRVTICHFDHQITWVEVVR